MRVELNTRLDMFNRFYSNPTCFRLLRITPNRDEPIQEKSLCQHLHANIRFSKTEDIPLRYSTGVILASWILWIKISK